MSSEKDNKELFVRDFNVGDRIKVPINSLGAFCYDPDRSLLKSGNYIEVTILAKEKYSVSLGWAEDKNYGGSIFKIKDKSEYKDKYPNLTLGCYTYSSDVQCEKADPIKRKETTGTSILLACLIGAAALSKLHNNNPLNKDKTNA
jgi:hypothetical protein